MPQEKNNWSAIFWTALIISVTNVILWNLFHRVIFIKSIYKTGVEFFKTEPGYFPVILLVATFIAAIFIVRVYQIMLSYLPKNWIIRGLLIGAILFLVIDLPGSLQIAFTTILPNAAAQSMIVSALFTKLINGIILTYTYRKFSSDSSETEA